MVSTKTIENNETLQKLKSKSKSPFKKNSNKVVIFDEDEIKRFMVQVWDQMSNNYGLIGDLQDRLDDKEDIKVRTKSRKNSKKKSLKKSTSRIKIKSKKSKTPKKKSRKKNRSKRRKKSLYDKSPKHSRSNAKNKLKKKIMKMNTLNRRSSTTENIKQQSFSTKPKKIYGKNKGMYLTHRNRSIR